MLPLHFRPLPMDQLAHPSAVSTADWVWPGYLARGNLTLLTSRWKAGKTTLLAGLLRALDRGDPFLDRPCPPASAVVVSEEAASHWAARHRAIPVGPRARLISRPFLTRPTPADWDDLVREAEAARQADGLDLLVIDPLASFLPGKSDSDPATLFHFLDPLRRLAEGGVAVLVLHHPRKAASEEGSTARGSGALLGFVDVVVELHAAGHLPADANRRRLVAFSRLPDAPRQLVYEWTPGTPDFRLVDDPALERFRDYWEVVRGVLAERQTAATHKELLADWPADRVPPSVGQLYEWLSRAAAEGWVTRSGGGTRNDPFRCRLPPPPSDFDLPPIPDLPPLDLILRGQW